MAKKNLIKDTKAELKKVVWPSKKQVISNTLMVLVLVIAVSLIVLGIDLVLEAGDKKLWEIIAQYI